MLGHVGVHEGKFEGFLFLGVIVGNFVSGFGDLLGGNWRDCFEREGTLLRGR